MVPTPSGAMTPVSIPGASRVRNPIMVTLFSMLCFVYGLVTIYAMMNELKAYLNKEEIVPWHIFVPILGIIVMLTKLPGWVTEAKQRAGSRNQQSAGPIMYFLLFPYFFTKDMNDVWDPMGTASPG
jgi:hypothetical protein